MPHRRVEDCGGICAPTAYINDSYCDDVSRQWGADFDCAQFNYGGGDCPRCPAGEVEDCGGVCSPQSYIGDNFCDDVFRQWGADFDCAQFSFDGGDC